MMTISELIKELEQAQSVCGDVPVIFSKDEEGNGFFSVDPGSRGDYIDCVIFWPGQTGERPENVLENKAE